MSPGEIGWRLRGAARELIDRARLRRVSPSDLAQPLLDRSDGTLGGGFAVLPEGFEALAPTFEHSELCRRADDAAAGYIALFDQPRQYIGQPPDWNRDHKHDIATPRGLSHTINYRSFRETGDCKFVWEPNRHQHLVILARAYRLTGKRCYAAAIAQQLESWLNECPFAHGMNWRSPLELGVRLINWVWCLDLIHDADVIGEALSKRIRESVALHVWDISRKYSRGSSANNHLIGEAAGVFIATAYFRELRGATRLRREAAAILAREIQCQTHADGGGAEQAFGYHGFITQFFTLAGIVARRSGEDFDRRYWARLERMYSFASAMLAGGDAPNFGDADDGYVLDLGENPRDFSEWAAVGAALFDRPDLLVRGSDECGPAQWLLAAAPMVSGGGAHSLSNAAFPESGLFLLQSGRRAERDAISVLFDCGPLGYGPLAAHGHADALSFTLRVNGREIFADPGTYDYFTYPIWRNYFRGTPAHNTITIDGRNQSELLGGFQWGRRADATCVEWSGAGEGGRVVGQHDGYAHGAARITHRRSIALYARGSTIRIEDSLRGRAGLAFEIRFHVGTGCRIAEIGESRVEIKSPEHDRVVLSLPVGLKLAIVEGGDEHGGGWNSRGYHRRTAAPTIIAAGLTGGDDKLITEICVVFNQMQRESAAGQQERLIAAGAVS